MIVLKQKKKISKRITKLKKQQNKKIKELFLRKPKQEK